MFLENFLFGMVLINCDVRKIYNLNWFKEFNLDDISFMKGIWVNLNMNLIVVGKVNFWCLCVGVNDYYIWFELVWVYDYCEIFEIF